MARIETIVKIFRIGVLDCGQLIRMTMLMVIRRHVIQQEVGITRAPAIRMHG
ncbi:hypothetical protein [Sphingomonas asaccharolytica]|uniref:hypothetical protein n=1 Tax=Sphingomonas asaccharolytica TaxID=40681 RepID=UPI000A56A64A|nr:hypothetical protein [Sphingomonas asaccharolytica]